MNRNMTDDRMVLGSCLGVPVAMCPDGSGLLGWMLELL